jgi:DNA-binding transcriptional MerR regulator
VAYSVGDVSRVSGVTVRTLHHYDAVGLLAPGQRSPAGYRLYSEDDLERLERILFYRELGFPLDEIVNILSDPDVGSADHLVRQHRMLLTRAERLQAMIAALEREMEAQHMGINLTPEDRFEVFGDYPQDEYAKEAEERWGGTDAYKESHRRTSAMTKEDWLRLGEESGGLEARMVASMQSGTPPTDPEAMDLAEEHRQQISRWFYDCSYEIHRGLGEMYVADPRFKARYDSVAVGLAEYCRDAIAANADRAGA